MTSSPGFQPYCPMGGSWYACGTGTKFTGCCDSNPCTNAGCSAGNLRPASFRNLTAWGKPEFPDQECSAGLWYTCTGTTPSFMGCCKSNPCRQNGCPGADLSQGFLSSNPTIANAYDPQPPLPGYERTSILPASTVISSATASAYATGSLTSVTASSTATNSPVVVPAESKGSSVGMIAGAAAGGGIALLLILLAIFLVYRRRKRVQYEKAHGALPPGKSWPTPSTTEYNPYYNDMSKVPMYSSAPNSALLSPATSSLAWGTPHTSPAPQIYEAASTEIGHAPYSPHSQYSPRQSPTWASDSGRTGGTQSLMGLGVRSVNGNSEYSRAELGSSGR